MTVAAITPTEAAGLITAAGTAGAAMMGAMNAWRKRKDEAARAGDVEETVVITQAQGANVILNATIHTLNALLDKAEKRAERSDARAATFEDRAKKAEVDLERCRSDLQHSRRHRA